MKKVFKNYQGSALLITILILTTIMGIAYGVADLVMSGIKSSRYQSLSTVALYAAEAGAERIVWEIRKNDFDLNGCADGNYINLDTNPAVCDSSVHSYTLSNGASYIITYRLVGGVTHLRSTGRYGGNKRAIDLIF